MTVHSLIEPHGGTLVDRVTPAHERAAALDAAAALTAVRLTPVQHSDLVCIATGVFSPLTGFVGRADYESILDRMRLANGTVWSLPITLAVGAVSAVDDAARAIRQGSTIALQDPD